MLNLMKRASLPVLMLLLSVACRQARQDDFTIYFIGLVKEFDANLIESEPSVRVMAHWHTEKDANGFTINVADTSFEEIDRLVVDVFGSTNCGEIISSALGPSRILKARDVGIALVYREDGDGVLMNGLKAEAVE